MGDPRAETRVSMGLLLTHDVGVKLQGEVVGEGERGSCLVGGRSRQKHLGAAEKCGWI